MYNKIVVPLDGSKLAEQVLPHLQQIAKGCGVTEVFLVTVTEKLKGRSKNAERGSSVAEHSLGATILYADRYYPSRVFSMDPVAHVDVTMGKMAKTGHDYLVKIAKKLDAQDIPSSIVVLYGNVAREIVHYSKEVKADLIIMASRGKGGLRKGDVANAAETVFKTVENTPILLVKPPYGFKETKPVRKGKPN